VVSRKHSFEPKSGAPVAQQQETTTSDSLPQINYAALAQTVLQAAGEQGSGDPSASKGGILTLVGTPIGHRGDITLRALLTLAQADVIFCEDTRVSGTLLRSYGITTPLESYHEHNAAEREAGILTRLLGGARCALVSDAGMPLVADPGFRLVRACHAARIPVTVCPGPSALLTGLTLATVPQLPFLFGGFLPPKSGARQKALTQWRTIAATLVFYESPQRLVDSLLDMVTVLGDRTAAVGRELTKLYEECRQGTLSELAAHYTAKSPKGEIVVMIAPPAATEGISDEELSAQLQQAMKTQSLRDAVASVTRTTGQPRDVIYKLALQLKEQ